MYSSARHYVFFLPTGVGYTLGASRSLHVRVELLLRLRLLLDGLSEVHISVGAVGEMRPRHLREG